MNRTLDIDVALAGIRLDDRRWAFGNLGPKSFDRRSFAGSILPGFITRNPNRHCEWADFRYDLQSNGGFSTARLIPFEHRSPEKRGNLLASCIY